MLTAIYYPHIVRIYIGRSDTRNGDEDVGKRDVVKWYVEARTSPPHYKTKITR